MTPRNPKHESDSERLKFRCAAFDAVGEAETHIRAAHAEGRDPLTRLDRACRAFDALGAAHVLVRGDADVNSKSCPEAPR